MTYDDFADKGYSCEPLEALRSEAWKDKPMAEWTENDHRAFDYQEMFRIRHEMMDIAADIN